MVAEKCDRTLDDFDLSESERIYFEARTARAVKRLAKETSSFRTYYELKTANPFLNVIAGSASIGSLAILLAFSIYNTASEPEKTYPILSACISVTVIALGWSLAGWIAHRNTVRQNTNTHLFARFSQQPFGENLHRFHGHFGHAIHPRVTPEKLQLLRASEDDGERKVAASVAYLLNYYEFISSGVIRGDLDKSIVKDRIKGSIIFFYDKCEPLIKAQNARNANVFEFLIKLRTHYREP